MFQSMIKLPKLLKILALVFLTATLSHAQPLPLTQAQRQVIQKIDNSIIEALQENQYHGAMFGIITACAISGAYITTLTDDDYREFARTFGNTSKELAKKIEPLMLGAPRMIWASARGGIIDDNQEIQDDFLNCMGLRYTEQKLGISMTQAQLLIKAFEDIIDNLETTYKNANDTEKLTLVTLIKTSYAARNASIEVQKMINKNKSKK